MSTMWMYVSESHTADTLDEAAHKAFIEYRSFMRRHTDRSNKTVGLNIYVIFVNGKPDSGKSYLAASLALWLGRGTYAHTYYVKLESTTTPELAMQIFRYLVAQVANQGDKGNQRCKHDLFVIFDADMLQSPENRLRMFEFCNLCNVLFSQIHLRRDPLTIVLQCGLVNFDGTQSSNYPDYHQFGATETGADHMRRIQPYIRKFRLAYYAFNKFLQDPENVQMLTPENCSFEPINVKRYQVPRFLLPPRAICHQQPHRMFLIEHRITDGTKLFRLSMDPETFQLFCTLYPVATPVHPFPFFNVTFVEVNEPPHVSVMNPDRQFNAPWVNNTSRNSNATSYAGHNVAGPSRFNTAPYSGHNVAGSSRFNTAPYSGHNVAGSSRFNTAPYSGHNVAGPSRFNTAPYSGHNVADPLRFNTASYSRSNVTGRSDYNASSSFGHNDAGPSGFNTASYSGSNAACGSGLFASYLEASVTGHSDYNASSSLGHNDAGPSDNDSPILLGHNDAGPSRSNNAIPLPYHAADPSDNDSPSPLGHNDAGPSRSNNEIPLPCIVISSSDDDSPGPLEHNDVGPLDNDYPSPLEHNDVGPLDNDYPSPLEHNDVGPSDNDYPSPLEQNDEGLSGTNVAGFDTVYCVSQRTPNKMLFCVYARRNSYEES